uniref:RxLR effector protein n=1 Tax=Phytophthora sojae TaxID=67593 RepID=G1FQX6_PHYSO|nr:Avh26 [Phytophthora sojae]
MRLSYVLLAAALLASGNSVSAATASTSQAATTGRIQSTDAVSENYGPRNLRTARFADVDDDDSEESDDDDSEETTKEECRNFSDSQISKMLKDTSYMNKKFEKWNEGGWSYFDVSKKIKDAGLLPIPRNLRQISQTLCRLE